MDHQEIIVYDSYHQGDGERRMALIKKTYLPDLFSVLKREKLIRTSINLRWESKELVPQQPDGDSCGAYVCYFMLGLLEECDQWTLGPDGKLIAHALRHMVARYIFYNNQER